jgi:ferredoxin
VPWISEELCIGCEICIDECCVDAISMEGGIAFIDEDECIRCGICHDICPNDAIRHDGERIPEEVESNLAWVGGLLRHEYYSNDRTKQEHLIERLQRHFAKEKAVAEKTMEQLELLYNTQYAE